MIPTLKIPQAPDIERAALGAALLEWKAAKTLVEQLSSDPEVFCKPNNSLIFKAIRELFEGNKPIDQLTLTHKLRDQGKLDNAVSEATIAGIAGEITSTANLPYHIDILKSKSVLRKLQTLGRSIVSNSQEDNADL